jgi:hypothetical protein
MGVWGASPRLLHLLLLLLLLLLHQAKNRSWATLGRGLVKNMPKRMMAGMKPYCSAGCTYQAKAGVLCQAPLQWRALPVMPSLSHLAVLSGQLLRLC